MKGVGKVVKGRGWAEEIVGTNWTRLHVREFAKGLETSDVNGKHFRDSVITKSAIFNHRNTFQRESATSAESFNSR